MNIKYISWNFYSNFHFFFSLQRLKTRPRSCYTQKEMARESSCLARVAAGAAVGGAVGGAVGTNFFCDFSNLSSRLTILVPSTFFQLPIENTKRRSSPIVDFGLSIFYSFDHSIALLITLVPRSISFFF